VPPALDLPRNPVLARQVGPQPELPDGSAEAHKAWLDFQNDVTVGDIHLAARENFRSVEHVKRYTTLGMASDQGKTSNVTAIEVLSGLLDKAPEQIGTTKFRPPFDPVTIGAFAGRSVGEDLMPLARLAAHERHLALGAAMEQYGSWLRPAFYRRPGEAEAEAVAREVLAVRTGVGLFEASPLGKIEVRGPDAAAFLDRMYVNKLSRLKPGRCRYALMLTEHGTIFDDGVIARTGEDRFLVGTTSGRAAAVAASFDEWLQCEWPDLRVLTEDVTTSWAVLNLAGPRSHEVLERVGTSIDLGAAAFPHMAYREGTLGGVRTRIQRVSFTGELSYEVAVPWRYGEALWDRLFAVGDSLGIAPFGVESLMTMRIEKGFLHVGGDTDGVTLPQDVGFGAIMAKKDCDFVGRRSTATPTGLLADRRQLVGLEALDGSGVLAVGAHVLPSGKDKGSDGWVTSAAMSPTLRKPVALGLVRQGRSRIGESVRVWDVGAVREARIVAPAFYDPAGERLNG
jgi:sarcosine oxidase subunit alpha